MNRLSRVVLVSALLLSGYSPISFAAYFFTLKDNGQPVGQVTDLPGDITVPAETLGTSDPVVFNIPNSLATSQVFLEKNGKCLDQGVNHVGLNQTLSSTSPTGYTLSLSVTVPTSTSCVSGNPDPIRIATITGVDVTDGTWSGTYHLYNTASVPEPGSLALLGLGLSALVFVKRRKAARH
jgi:hypothetical protein